MHQQDGHTHAQRLCTQEEEDEHQGRGEPISVWLWRAADLTESFLPVKNFKTAISLSKQANLAFFFADPGTLVPAFDQSGRIW